MLQINAAKPGLARRGDGAGRAFKKNRGFCRGVPAAHPRTQRLTPRCRILLRTVQSRRRRRGGTRPGPPRLCPPGEVPRCPGPSPEVRMLRGKRRRGARRGSFRFFSGVPHVPPLFTRWSDRGETMRSGVRGAHGGTGDTGARLPGTHGQLRARLQPGRTQCFCHAPTPPLPPETPSKSGLKK